MKKYVVAVSLAVLGLAPGVQASDFTSVEICKAAISVEMSRPTKTMKARSQGATPEISYKRPDGESFRYRCQVSDASVVWSTFLNDTHSWGRWRNRYSEGDARITYSASGSELTIQNDQSGDKTFRKSDF